MLCANRARVCSSSNVETSCHISRRTASSRAACSVISKIFTKTSVITALCTTLPQCATAIAHYPVPTLAPAHPTNLLHTWTPRLLGLRLPRSASADTGQTSRRPTTNASRGVATLVRSSAPRHACPRLVSAKPFLASRYPRRNRCNPPLSALLRHVRVATAVREALLRATLPCDQRYGYTALLVRCASTILVSVLTAPIATALDKPSYFVG